MTDKNLGVVTGAGAQANGAVIVGDGNLFQVLAKAFNEEEGWMKTTKAMEIPGVGCVVQITTQQGDQVAEALTFVPGVKVVADTKNPGGRVLVSI